MSQHTPIMTPIKIPLTFLGAIAAIVFLINLGTLQTSSSGRRNEGAPLLNSNIFNATVLKSAAPQAEDVRYGGVISEHPVCSFFRSNANRHAQGSEAQWGTSKSLCMEPEALKWLQRSRANCYSCINPKVNVCRNPPLLTYHMSLDHVHTQAPEANLLAMQAFLLTQDLSKAKLILWVLGERELVYTNATKWFFDAFSEYVSIRTFDYDDFIKGTSWEDDSFFGNGTLVAATIRNAACYSDLVRFLILHRHGGVWMDTDVIFFQDMTHTFLTSYQFVMRWTNNHVMRFEAGSALTHRVLEVAKMMPANHPRFKEDIVAKMCKEVGYMPAHGKYENMDIYNTCLLRMLKRVNNTGPADAILYDLPLGWWDPDWVRCYGLNSRQSANDSVWELLASTHLTMHNRYPGDLNLGPEDSPLQRVIRIVRGFFKACRTAHCVPVHGAPLLTFDGMYEHPPQAHRLL